MKISFTKTSINKLVCTSEHGRQYVGDTKCRGLYVEVRSTGGKTYYLNYRDQRGRQRNFKLANADDISPRQARELCERMRAKVAMGEDILLERQQLKKVPRVIEFFNDRYLPYVKSYKRSWETDVSVFSVHVLPVIGDLYMDSVKAEHIAALMLKLSAKCSNGMYNKALVLLRFMFNLAIKWETPGMVRNPTATQQLKRVSKHRERFLSAEETKALLESVNRSTNRMLRYIIPMLLLTGARKREVLDARWSDIDRQRKFWRIPFTKNGRERYVPLSPEALDLLDRIPRRRNCDTIFFNPDTLEPFQSIYYAWDTARRKAGLADVRVHDLRHSFASFLVNAGCSLYEVQQILGHASSRMTQRYAHLNQETLLRAVGHAADVVGQASRA